MDKKRNSTWSKLIKNRTPTLGYSLGLQKIEGTKTPNVINHRRREGHAGLNHTIKPCIGCSSEWRKKDSNWSTLSKNHTPTLGYSLGFQKIEGTKTPNVIHHRRREGHAGLNPIIKPCIGCSSEWRTTLSKLSKNHTPTLGYSLGFQKIEGSKTPNVIHHRRREGHAGLNHIIKPCIGCSSEWRTTWSKLSKNRTPTLGYSLGLQKIEGTKTHNVIHQRRREGHAGLNHTIKPCIGCSSEWRKKEIQVDRNWAKITLRHWYIALDSKKLKVPRHQMLYTTDVEKVMQVSTIPSNLAWMLQWMENNLIETEQKSHSDTGL